MFWNTVSFFVQNHLLEDSVCFGSLFVPEIYESIPLTLPETILAPENGWLEV